MKYISIIIAVLALIITVGMNLKSKKIGVVRTAFILEEYQGMKEALVGYETMQKDFENKLKTLQVEVQGKIDRFNIDSLSYNESGKTKQKLNIKKLQFEFYKANEIFEKKLAEEDDKIILNVMNQINASIKKFGDDNGYNIILGTQELGTVLYLDEADDISDEVLEMLNKDYKGE